MGFFTRNQKKGGTKGGNLLRRIARKLISTLTVGIYDGTDGNGPANPDNFLW